MKWQDLVFYCLTGIIIGTLVSMWMVSAVYK